jgi:pimeloyl-ACP methyl ester carboxylesterase
VNSTGICSSMAARPDLSRGGIHEAVPGSSFVIFEADEGGGHAMFWEGPQKYNDSLRTFMRSS